MTTHKLKSFISFAVLATALLGPTRLAMSQGGNPNPKTNSRITYHDGPVMRGQSNLYLIWYGNWAGDTAPIVLTDLASNIGGTSYFTINATYPDATGVAPSGALIYSGATSDFYSRGATLTESDIEAIIANQISAGVFPLDPSGIYLVLAPGDVTDLRTDGTTFCTPGNPPLHRSSAFFATLFYFGFIGSAARCPTIAAPQFIAPDGTLLLTPNDNFAADAMANTMARLLNVMVTSPLGTSGTTGGWYDRYGLENADKCIGKFGRTYPASNGSRANIRLGMRDYLLQENWVNDRKGRCALSGQ